MSGVHSCMGTISRPSRSRQSLMVRPTFLSLGVAGFHLTWILNPWWSPVTRYRCLTSPAANIYLEDPNPSPNLEGHLHPGTDGVLGIQGGGFLFGPALRLGFSLACGFGLCGRLVLLRTLAAPGIGLSPLGRYALGLLYRRVARCKDGVLTGSWDVRLGRGDGVLQLEHLLGHEAKHFLGILRGVGRVRGPGEETVPRACSVAAHVGRVAGGMACPRWGAFRGEGALLRPLRRVEGVVQRFPGCLWGVGDVGGESQAFASAWWGRDFVVGGVCRCPSDLAMVVAFHCPPDVPVFEDVDLRGGRGGVHGVSADELDGADLGVGPRGCSRAENSVDVLSGRARAGGVLRCLG